MSTGRVVMLRAHTNERLALAAQAGDRAAEEALLARFGGYVRTLASPYYDATGDADDLLQEARLGALKAVRDWRADGGASFKTFLGLCVTRNIHTHVTWSNRQKHQMLTHSLREATNEDGDTVDALELAVAPNTDPAELLDRRAAVATIVEVITGGLSPLERNVFDQWVNGQSYVETAQELGLAFSPRPDGVRTRSKAVDNALQRARRKLRVALDLPEPRPLGAAA